MNSRSQKGSKAVGQSRWKEKRIARRRRAILEAQRRLMKTKA
jgi:hypothetical protein